jgi:soluble lytic murein transglycosylase
MHKFVRSLALLACALPAIAHAGLEEQRKLFKEAYDAVSAGVDIDIERVTERLGDYPLAPYLHYGYLRGRIDQATPEQIQAFVTDHPQLPVGGILRASMLERLARRGRWQQFLALYQPSTSAELSCYALQAKAALKGIDAEWLAAGKRVWMTDKSLPAACDPIARELFSRRALTVADAWERIMALIVAGETRTAAQLRWRLEPEQQRWLDHWLAIHAQPEKLAKPPFALKGEQAAAIAAHGLRRLARRDAERALELFQQLEKSQLWSPLAAAALQRDIVLNAAYSQDPAALPLLDALPKEAVTPHVQVWQARLALRVQDWKRLVMAIDALPAQEREESQWRYWRAHALDAEGHKIAARAAFQKLARERNYYGFLAADRLDLPYQMEHEPARFAVEELAAIGALPGIRRAEEFFRLDMKTEARREWLAAVAGLDRDQKAKAAALALQWGWYDRAIFTANDAGLHDALNLRFPTPYRERVEFYSREQRLDPWVTYAILRKESAFRADAVSPVGAMGLMQVMPETGRRVARQLNYRLPSKHALLDVDTNLMLGSAYLRAMLDRYSGNLVLAAAAYNAGPHRVSDWLQRNQGLPPEVWIEAISFYETRDYVKSVLAFATVFGWQLDGKPRRLSEYLAPLDGELACLEPEREDRPCVGSPVSAPDTL